MAKGKYNWADIIRSNIRNAPDLTDAEANAESEQTFDEIELAYVVPETQEQTIEFLKSIPEEDFKMIQDAIKKMNAEDDALEAASDEA